MNIQIEFDSEFDGGIWCNMQMFIAENGQIMVRTNKMLKMSLDNELKVKKTQKEWYFYHTDETRFH